ncbi:MAG TPA: biotin--[acetyl-CoA-carboxylase] ligase [Kofleriaceae bacterium]|nr:biotin--[acetyl-CoA-carboxylase] ligase [Kofleriaceae bacterium]
MDNRTPVIRPVAGPASWLGSHRIELDECDSTNDEAAQLARAGARSGTIVIARAQRAGRGRAGRSWASPRDMGLYLSAVIRPPLSLASVPPLTLAIGVGVCDAARAAGAPAALKWPNDAFVHGRKLAGVLVEAQSQGDRLEAIIVGIGVNLTGALPPEVADTAITLADAVGAPVDRAAFVEQLLAHVERWIDRYTASGLAAIVPEWRARMATGLRGRARIDGADVTGEIAALDDDGALVLRDDRGRLHRVRSGDVEVMRPGRS